MNRWLIFFALMTAPLTSFAAEPPTVVLLHGLGLGSWAMKRVEWALEREGYRVINVSYRSRSVPLERLADEWLPALLDQHRTAEAPTLHFVTHSMGSVLLRAYLANHAPINLGRVVMIAPPNHGTRLVDQMGDWWAFRAFMGVNGHRLGTDTGSFPLSLGPWTYAAQLGIIAGDRTLNHLFSKWTGPGPNDGKVTVVSTRLDGMSDHLTLPISHTWLQYRRSAIDQVCAFLRDGAFARER